MAKFTQTKRAEGNGETSGIGQGKGKKVAGSKKGSISAKRHVAKGKTPVKKA